MDIEQIIRAVFKADASGALASAASLDRGLAGLEDQATATAAAVAKSIDPAMADRMAKARLDAARVSAPDWGLDEIAALERELKGLPPIKDKIDIDPAMQERLMESQLIAEDLSWSLKDVDKSADKVSKSSTKAAGGLGKMWQGAKTLTNILPGLGMSGLIGGAIAAIEALFDLIGGDQMDAFSRGITHAAATVHDLAVELGEAANKAGALFQDPNDMAGKLIAQQIKNAKSLEEQAKNSRGAKPVRDDFATNDAFRVAMHAWRRNNDDEIEAAHAEVMRLEKAGAIHSAETDLAKVEQRQQSLMRLDPELHRKYANAVADVEELGQKVDQFNAMKFESGDKRGHGGLTDSQWSAYVKAAEAYEGAQATLAAADYDLKLLSQQRSQADDAVKWAQEAVSFAKDFNPANLAKPKDVNVNVANARINIQQRIDTNDPGELAGATLVNAFRHLTNRVIRPEGMTAPTGRAR